MCTGRLDLAFVLRAFQDGADGVIVGGCWPGECHYVTEGNYDALGNVYLGKKLLEWVGLKPERLRIEWISAAEGSRFAEVMSDFAGQLHRLGPLGQAECIADSALRLKLEAVSRIVPYLKLVERQKLRVMPRTEQAYRELYASDELDRLFDELIAHKLVVSQILLLLQQGPLSTREISEQIGLSPPEVSRQLKRSSQQGLVRYDIESKRYARA